MFEFMQPIEDYVRHMLYSLDSIYAIVLFMPLVLYEIFNYFLPAVALKIIDWTGLSRKLAAAEKAFYETSPFISIVIAGRNESEIIESNIRSLLSLPYENREIIIVDDHSDDNMYEICRPYADKGLIRLFRNDAVSGRSGRAIASNFGLHEARGEIIVSLDADTSYDYDMLEKMIGPFCNPKVGVVAGNLKVMNQKESIWTVCQAIEYAISIGVWKRWTSYVGVTLQASGAFGAFRKEALTGFGGWDPELAEDADISLKMRRAGWDIAFAPYAIAMTHVPVTLTALVKQRIRWDKGTIRTYFHKHRDMLWNFKKGSRMISLELCKEFFMIYLLSLMYCVYTVYLLIYDWRIYVFAQVSCYFFYTFWTFVTLLISICDSERRSEEWFLLLYVPFFSLYKEIFRWVRIYANIMETFRWKYRENYLPPSGYTTPPW